MKHSYPQDLAPLLKAHWDHVPVCLEGEKAGKGCVADLLPDLSTLEWILSVCYQASLMTDEGRAVTFRLMFRESGRIEAEGGSPAGLHWIAFTEPRSFDEQELRRLAPVVDFYRSLIGTTWDREKGLQVWGVVHSGSRWIQTVHGGRKTGELLPPSLVVRVTGPGRLAVCKGSITIATLNSGRIACPAHDAAVPGWLLANFKPGDDRLREMHRKAREIRGESWSVLDDAFIKVLTREVYKRIVSMMRSRHHGGTIILIPRERVTELTAPNRCLDIKYQFAEGEPRRRLESLYLQLLKTLVEEGGKRGILHRPIGWSDYVATDSSAIERLDEAIFETAHFIADLTAADGAVVMTKCLELLGFGAEILSRSGTTETIARVLDAEGFNRRIESTHGMGTRHRSAYRLCHELRDVVAIMASQDGTVRIIMWQDDMVVYWDQTITSVLDL